MLSLFSHCLQMLRFLLLAFILVKNQVLCYTTSRGCCSDREIVLRSVFIRLRGEWHPNEVEVVVSDLDFDNVLNLLFPNLFDLNLL